MQILQLKSPVTWAPCPVESWILHLEKEASPLHSSNLPASSKRPWSYFTHWIAYVSRRSMILENTRNDLQGKGRQAGWNRRPKGWLLTIWKRRCCTLWIRSYAGEKPFCTDLQSPGKQLKKFTACQCWGKTAKKEEQTPRQEMQGRIKPNICFLVTYKSKCPKSVGLASYEPTISQIGCYRSSKVLLVQGEPRVGSFQKSGFSEKKGNWQVFSFSKHQD